MKSYSTTLIFSLIKKPSTTGTDTPGKNVNIPQSLFLVTRDMNGGNKY